MPDSDRNPTTLTDVVAELRRMWTETARRDEELWDAVDEIRRLVAGNGNADKASATAAQAPTDGADARSEAATYRRLKRRMRLFVGRAVPQGARVAVVSRGDESLLDLPGIEAEHFPRQPGGEYTGFYPNDGWAAIAHFEWVRAEGAEYLLFPETSTWWLDRFPRLSDHIRSRCPEVAREDGVGVLFGLRDGPRDAERWPEVLREVLEAWEEQNGTPPSILDWGTGHELAAHLPGRTVFTPPERGAPLPYLDASVDVVAVADGSPDALAEARRVARRTVVLFDPDREDGVDATEGSALHAVEHRGDAPDAPPSATVVIPTFNGLANLVPCLRALNDTLPSRFAGQVLVVDDASGPETAAGLERLRDRYPWLRVVRNERNAGFIGSCNRGAAEADGEFLVFLNDDTVPLAGWLGALLRTFRTHPDAGAVGGRLVYPDGRLQEAGGLIFRDGSGANFGRGDYEVDAPVYAHVRPVHYCSGALLATPRTLFHDLGGFDARYAPAYYEDTDYCFTVRRSGRRVYYQPDAVVVHVEGATSGTDLESGVKRYQARNRTTFLEKWHAELAELAPAPSRYSAHTWHRLAFHGGEL